jgi:capsular exopolysaccharide synthesis family protein
MSTAATIRPTAVPLQPRASAPPVPATGMALDPVRLLKKYYLLLIAAAFAGAVLGTAAHFILAKTYPRYTASATFGVLPQQKTIEGIGSDNLTQDDLLRFTGTQMSIMTSTPILEKVLREPDVEGTDWAKQFVYRGRLQPQDAQPELEKVLNVRAIPQTSLISLSMTWRRADDVRTIVDAVTRVYLAEVRSNSSSESVARRDVLAQQISLISGQISDLNSQRDSLLQNNQVTDIAAGLAQEDIKTKELSEKYVQTVSALAATRSQYNRYQEMLEKEITITYPDNVREAASRDPLIVNLDQQIANFRTDNETLKRQGFGPEHPIVIASAKRIEAAEQERKEAHERILKKLFASEVDQLRMQVDGLEATRTQVNEELKSVDKRKQDLTRLRIVLKDIEDEVKTKTEERIRLEASRKQLELLLGNQVFDRVKLLVPAQVPKTMSFPQLKILIPLGTVLLCGLTAGLVVLREVLDQRVRGPADLATMARVRVLGMVSDAQEDPTRPSNLATAFRDAPSGVTAESFRLLRAPLVKAMDQAGHKTLLVLAGMPGSGATTVATNLGLACAGAEERVLIIDANLRRPGVQKALGLPDGPGLGDVLVGATSLDEAVRPTSAANLYVLTVGSAANRAMPERLASESMARLLSEAKGKFDRIFIDSAPAIVSGDGLALAHRVDAVTLVVRALSEKRGLVARLRGQLAESRGEFLGVIVNAVRASAGGYLRGNIKATHEYQHGAQAA